jgi:hypothetical protein
MPATKIMLIRHAEKPNGDAGLMPEGPDRAWLDPRQRAGRPVRSCEWSCPAAAAREADQSLRLGIGKPAPQADDRAVGRGAQSPGHDVAEGPRGRARRRGQGGRRSGSRLLAARGDSRDRDADPGPGGRHPPGLARPSIRSRLGVRSQCRRDVELCAGAAAPASGRLWEADRLGRLDSGLLVNRRLSA